MYESKLMIIIHMVISMKTIWKEAINVFSVGIEMTKKRFSVWDFDG